MILSEFLRQSELRSRQGGVVCDFGRLATRLRCTDSELKGGSSA